MRKLTYTLLLGTALFTLAGCDDVLEDFDLDVAVYGRPGYSTYGPGGYYKETVVEEYWYEETYYEDSYYDDGWSFWPW